MQLEFLSLLKDCGLTQRELGRKLGYTPTAVNRWAKGHVDVPRVVMEWLKLYKYVQRMKSLDELTAESQRLKLY